MDMSEFVNAVARSLAQQKDGYLRPFVEAGLDPNRYVLEEGPLVSGHASLNGTSLVFTQTVRLRPKTDEEMGESND